MQHYTYHDIFDLNTETYSCRIIKNFIFSDSPKILDISESNIITTWTPQINMIRNFFKNEIDAWIKGILSTKTTNPNNYNEHFRFIPFIKPTTSKTSATPAPRGGKAVKNSYKRTQNFKQYKLKKYEIFEGERSGQYIRLNNKYVSLKKLNE
jgi:hypothetical protein